MIDRSLVTSGFDTETVVSEEYLTYLLLAQIEAGLLEMSIHHTENPPPPAPRIDQTITLHPPEDYQRLYEPDPSITFAEPVNRSFFVRLLPDGDVGFLHLLVFVTIKDNLSNDPPDGPLPMGMFVNLEIIADSAALIFETNHRLRSRLVRLDDSTRGAIAGKGGDPDKVEAELRQAVDRDLPLGVAQGQAVQQIRMRKFIDGNKRSLGLYVNLALRSGPEPAAFELPRGDLTLAQDLRPSGAPLAFSTSPGLFGLLSRNLKFSQAEETEPGSGEFRFPIREDMLDPESDEIGRIKGISVGPEIGINGLTGRLVIDIHGEYTDAPGDPDFHLEIFFNPKIQDGLVEWDIDVDVDLGLLATLLLIAAGIGLTLLFGPVGGVGGTLFVGTILGLAVLKGLIAEPLAAKIVADRLDEEQFASFFDSLPFRVPAVSRRWDPFYITDHQVVTLVDSVTIDPAGIAFEGTGLRLDKQPVPVTHVVIRDEERGNLGKVEALRYRVSDFANISTDLEASGPGRDRMEFSRTDPVNEPTLVSLTLEQIAARIEAKRLLAPITYNAERIHLVNGQIDHLLCLSRRERGEARDRAIRRFRDSTRAQIRADQGADIRAQVIVDLTTQLGRAPTEQEIGAEVDRRINALVTELEPAFITNKLPIRHEEEVARILRFDLLPEEFVALQQSGVLLLDGKEIIVRHNKNGRITPYFRDRPDGDKRDNLLSLPRYSPPYKPPP